MTWPWPANANVSLNREKADMTKKKSPRSTNELTTLDEFLKEEGKLEEFEAVAIKEVLAWQIAEAMKTQNLSRKRLAQRMGTSRSQIGRLLDPKAGNVTLATLQRAAKIAGRTFRRELVYRYSIEMFAALMMGPLFTPSSAMKVLKSSGVPPPACMSNLARSCLPLSLAR